jgi:PIN domain nuclease of toxin-antitoxin system
MKLLLDTHIFLWWDADDTRLPVALKEAIADPQNAIYVSAASVWEIAIKRATGKLTFSSSAAKAIAGHGFHPLPITIRDSEWAGALPLLHRDPFDRLLVAQAQLEGCMLVTVDERILGYQVPHL